MDPRAGVVAGGQSSRSQKWRSVGAGVSWRSVRAGIRAEGRLEPESQLKLGGSGVIAGGRLEPESELEVGWSRSQS